MWLEIEGSRLDFAIWWPCSPLPEVIFLLWGPFSWERVNTYTTSWTNCLIQEGKKKFSQKIGCQWIIAPQIQGLVCVGRASKWKNVLSMCLRVVPALRNHLHYGSLCRTHHVRCVLLPSSLKPVMEFFKNIWGLFQIRIHSHQCWLYPLSHFSLSLKPWQFETALRWGEPLFYSLIIKNKFIQWR